MLLSRSTHAASSQRQKLERAFYWQKLPGAAWPRDVTQRPNVQACVSTLSRDPAPSENLKERYDVYVHEPVPLNPGEEKHVISVFVGDESGLINRVAGVFARRGSNIESMAVGLTVDKALFTIVVTGTSNTIATLVKQLSKLVQVKFVEDITDAVRVEREMMLIKVQVPGGAERTEVLQLAQIFRAKVVDVADNTCTLCVSGDPGKLAAIQKVMNKFGIVEIARTGRICLQRGERLNSQHHEHHSEDTRVVPKPASKSPVPKPPAADPTPAPPAEKPAQLYEMVSDAEDGVWQVQNILDPVYSDKDSGYNAHTLSIEVSDEPGVLNQVTGVFSRRGYNIQSLAVGPCEQPDMSRICMVVPGSEESIQKLFRQLGKLIYVQSMVDLTHMPFVQRELMLVKVTCTAKQRGELRHLEQIFRASILDVSPTTAIIEVAGKEEKLKALTDLLKPFGILEIARTGRIALLRDSGVSTPYLERMAIQKVY